MDIKYLSNLKLGSIELERAKKLISENSLLLFENLIETYGLLVGLLDTDSYSDHWKVAKSGNNQVTVEAGKAVLYNNYPRQIVNSSQLTLDIPTADGTYKLLLSYSESNFENGTVSVENGNATVTGTDTEFTKIFGVNRRIIINDTAFQVLSVQSDTELTLATTYSGTTESGANFKVGGWFTSYPVSVADNLIYVYDSFEITAKTTAKLDTEYWLAEIVVSGGVITTVTDKRDQNIFKMFLNTPTVLGTPASTFKVGDSYVELESDLPEDVINLRITDVYGRKDLVDSTMSTKVTRVRRNQDELNVLVKWGYDNIVGVGGVSQFTVQTQDLTFSNNELIGYFLYIPQVSKNLKITGNTGNVLDVEEIGGNSVDLSGVNVLGSNPAWIHNNADKYQVIAIPYQSDAQQIGDRVESEIILQQSPTIQQALLRLITGAKYLIKVRAIKGKLATNYSEMPAGSYTKYSVTQNYSKPYIAKHPQISDTGSGVGAIATRNGFRVTISGWEEAEQYEVCYTTDNSGADFNNSAHTKIVTVQKQLDINTTVSADYNVKVRPLISGQEVGTPISKSVTSGSNGQAPEDRIVATIPINHITYSGSAVYNSGVPNIITVSSLKTPANSANSLDVLPESVVGKIITLNSQDYVISGKNSSTTFEIQPLGNGTLPSSGTYAFSIGTSERGRRFYISTLKQDHRLTRAEFDCDFIKGGNTTIRIYQLLQDGESDNIIVNANDSQFSIPCDHKVLSSNGARTLIVDGYDVAELLNNNSIVGRLVVYGVPSTLENINASAV